MFKPWLDIARRSFDPFNASRISYSYFRLFHHDTFLYGVITFCNHEQPLQRLTCFLMPDMWISMQMYIFIKLGTKIVLSIKYRKMLYFFVLYTFWAFLHVQIFYKYVKTRNLLVTYDDIDCLLQSKMRISINPNCKVTLRKSNSSERVPFCCNVENRKRPRRKIAKGRRNGDASVIFLM